MGDISDVSGESGRKSSLTIPHFYRLLQDNRKVCVDFHKLIALGAPESPFSGAPTPVSTNCSSDNDDDDDDDDNDSVGELRELAGLDINDPALDIFAFDESLFEPPLRVKVSLEWNSIEAKKTHTVTNSLTVTPPGIRPTRPSRRLGLHH